MSQDSQRPQRIPKRSQQRGEAEAPAADEPTLSASPTVTSTATDASLRRLRQTAKPSAAQPRSGARRTGTTLVNEAPQLNTDPATDDKSLIARVRRWLKTAPALSFSLVVHLVVFALLGVVTFATLQPKEELTITASAVEVSETTMDELVEIDISELEDFEDQPLETELPELSDMVVEEVAVDAPPAEAVPELAGTAPPVGTAAADAAKALAAGGPAGKNTRKGSTSFYGAPAQGNRFAFIVDNSKSMVNGKMLTTIDQLLRTVNSLKAKQEFYIIFYSDQAYLMFHPVTESSWVPATQANKNKVFQWLRSVQLCQGGRLDAALKKAFALEPDTIFVVGDGTDVGEAERKVLMAQLKTRRYPINTLCIGGDGAAAKRLENIATLSGGNFQFVRPSPQFVEMAKSLKFQRNPQGQAWQ